MSSASDDQKNESPMQEEATQNHFEQEVDNSTENPINQTQDGMFNTRTNLSMNDTEFSYYSQTNIYISGLPKDFEESDMNELCRGLGRIKSLKVIICPETNQCKGYGFVDFELPESADNAVKRINKTSPFNARLAKERYHDPNNLYFARLSPDVTEERLKSILCTHGTVLSVRILRDTDGVSRGAGFARMQSQETCEEIIRAKCGKVCPELGKEPLLIRFADRTQHVHRPESNLNTCTNPTPEYYPQVYPPPYASYPLNFTPVNSPLEILGTAAAFGAMSLLEPFPETAQYPSWLTYNAEFVRQNSLHNAPYFCQLPFVPSTLAMNPIGTTNIPTAGYVYRWPPSIPYPYVFPTTVPQVEEQRDVLIDQVNTTNVSSNDHEAPTSSEPVETNTDEPQSPSSTTTTTTTTTTAVDSLQAVDQAENVE